MGFNQKRKTSHGFELKFHGEVPTFSFEREFEENFRISGSGFMVPLTATVGRDAIREREREYLFFILKKIILSTFSFSL